MELSQNEKNEPCILSVRTKNKQFCINGFNIVSESRTLEISSDVDGYLVSVRGIPVDTDVDDMSRTQLKQLFCSKCFLKDPQFDLSIKVSSCFIIY